VLPLVLGEVDTWSSSSSPVTFFLSHMCLTGSAQLSHAIRWGIVFLRQAMQHIERQNEIAHFLQCTIISSTRYRARPVLYPFPWLFTTGWGHMSLSYILRPYQNRCHNLSRFIYIYTLNMSRYKKSATSNLGTEKVFTLLFAKKSIHPPRKVASQQKQEVADLPYTSASPCLLFSPIRASPLTLLIGLFGNVCGVGLWVNNF
jgi:hypothetical protein